MRTSTAATRRSSTIRWARYFAGFLFLAFLWNLQYIYSLLEPRTARFFSTDTSKIDPPKSSDGDLNREYRDAQHEEHRESFNENTDQRDSMDIYDRAPLVSTANISSDTALDAIGRAKSDHCRKQLIDTAYLREHTPNVLTPAKLPRSCPMAVPSKYRKYIGCYSDHPKDRLLKSGEYNLVGINSIDHCIMHCLRAGQELAGVQYGSECFCGSKRVLKQTVPLTNDGGCQAYKCPGNGSEFCGGFKMMAVYETGVGRKAPVNVKHVGDDEQLEDTAPVKIVFLLQFNGRSTRQVRRMLKLLYRRKHFYYVHVDARQSYMYREMLELERVLPNLKVKRKRFSSIWGGASLLAMMMDAFKELLDEFRFWPWEYVINLSEADMPLVSVDTVERLLIKYRTTNFLRSHGNGTASFIRKQGLDQLFSECENHMYRLGKRQLPDGIRFDGGSDWFGMHRSLIEYAVRGPEKPEENPLVSGLAKMYERTLLPAESYFHTLALNSGFCVKVADTNLKLTNWRRKQGCKCQYKHIVDWCGCSPNVLTMDEFDRLEQPVIFDRLDYFARKFDAMIDQSVIRKVEAQIQRQEEEMNSMVENAAKADAAQKPKPESDRTPKLDSDRTQESPKVKSRRTEPENIPGFHAYWENQYDILDESMDQLRKSDYPTWLLLRSLSRLAMDHVFENVKFSVGARCKKRCKIGTVERMHVFQEADVFGGILVQLNGTCKMDSGQGEWSVEAFVKRLPNTTRNSEANNLAKTLLNLEVGTKFDVKEEIFRNYAGAMTVDGTIAIRHQYDTAMLEDVEKKKRKVEIVFFAPDGQKKGAYVQKLNNPTGFEYTQLPITKSYELESGIWRVQLRSQDGVVIGETSFPLLPADNAKNEQEDVAFVDKLISQFYRVEFVCRAAAKSSDFKPPTDECQKIFTPAEKDVKIGSREEEIKAGDSNSETAGRSKLENCKRTHWSSLSPDPKSEISGFDWKSGVILAR